MTTSVTVSIVLTEDGETTQHVETNSDFKTLDGALGFGLFNTLVALRDRLCNTVPQLLAGLIREARFHGAWGSGALEALGDAAQRYLDDTGGTATGDNAIQGDGDE
ncbi:MAG: hypothetical protein BIFFINMI_00947 [Phycisphaerae bacterium]|nr:hypothetical protein [Phycisphaerae bacterium]